MGWESGRQGTGYLKKKLAQGRAWDLWLLKYPAGSSVPTHTDPVPGKKHWRLNVVLQGPDNYRGDAIVRLPRIVFFRPDVTPHAVEQVSTQRLVLSLGWVT